VSGLAWDAAAIALYAIAAALQLHALLSGGIRNFAIGPPWSNDPQIFMWGLAWYPHALTHGLDPLFTNNVFAPSGYNLAWSTTLPAPALLMWPITTRFGPLVSFNLLCILTPILSAYTAFALCRHISRRPLPSLVGGLVYGFSTYQIVEADHLNLALTFIPPLLALLFVSRCASEIGRVRYVSLFAACLIFQFLISPEVFETATLFGVIAIAISAWMGDHQWRIRLRSVLGESIVAILTAVVVLSPYIYRFVPSPFGLSPIYNPAHCSTDLLGFVIPTWNSLAGRIASAPWYDSIIGYGCEPAAYMGLLPVIAVWLALASRAKPANAFPVERFLALTLFVIMLIALGPIIHVNGIDRAPSVWLPALVVPIVNNALPARFVLYAFLTLSVIVTLWLCDSRRQATTRWVAAIFALISVLPGPVPEVPATLPFFTQQSYREYLSPNETIAVLPFGPYGEAMKWQAQSNFYFRVAGGYFSFIPHEYAAWPIVVALMAQDPYIPGYGDQFKAFLAAHAVSTLLVTESAYPKYAKLAAALEVPPIHVGGVVLFRLTPASLASADHATADTMDTRFNNERYTILIRAAREFLAQGNSPRDLNPFAAERLGLIDATVAGYPLLRQTSGFPMLHAVTEAYGFHRVADYLISHQMIRERLAIELGPVKPKDATKSGIWLGPWNDDSIAVGVVASRSAAASLIARFGAKAESIYYPYPLRYSAQPSIPGDPQMLLMTFKIAVLPALGESPQPHN
jgi:hypothetical protein